MNKLSQFILWLALAAFAGPADAQILLSAYSPDPTGVTSSSSAFAAAIAAAQALGCPDIIIGNGIFKLTSTITLGNGSSAAVSTLCAPRLLGAGIPSEPNLGSGYPNTPPTRLIWGGTGGGSMIQIAGPLDGWGLRNLYLDCNSSAGRAIQVESGRFGDSGDLAISNCTVAGIDSETVANSVSGVWNVDSLHNAWKNIVVQMLAGSNTIGVNLSGNNATSNTDYNTFDNITIAMGGNGASTGIYLGATDSDIFHGVHFFNGGSQTVCFTFDYSVNAYWPTGVIIDGADTIGCATPFKNIGLPATEPNIVTNLQQGNGATWPTAIGNLYYTLPVGTGAAHLTSQNTSLPGTTITALNPVSIGGLYRLSFYEYIQVASGAATITPGVFWSDDVNIKSFYGSPLSCASLGYVSGTALAYIKPGGGATYNTTIAGAIGNCTYAIYVSSEKVQ